MFINSLVIYFTCIEIGNDAQDNCPFFGHHESILFIVMHDVCVHQSTRSHNGYNITLRKPPSKDHNTCTTFQSQVLHIYIENKGLQTTHTHITSQEAVIYSIIITEDSKHTLITHSYRVYIGRGHSTRIFIIISHIDHT